MITYLPINQQVVFGRFTERSRRWLRSNNHLELLLNPYWELQQKKAHRSPSKLRSSLPEKVHKSRAEYTNQRNLFDMEINNNHYSIIPFTKRDQLPFHSSFPPSVPPSSLVNPILSAAPFLLIPPDSIHLLSSSFLPSFLCPHTVTQPFSYFLSPLPTFSFSPFFAWSHCQSRWQTKEVVHV